MSSACRADYPDELRFIPKGAILPPDKPRILAREGAAMAAPAAAFWETILTTTEPAVIPAGSRPETK